MWIELLKDILGQKAGQRIDVAEADAQGLISQGFARPCAQDPTAEIIGKALGEAMGKLTASLNTAVEGALKQFAQTQTKSLRTQRKLLFGEGDGDPQKPTFGKFLLAVRSNDKKALEEMGSRFVEWSDEGVETKAALSTQTGVSGGYLVPVEFYDRLMKLVTEKSVVRPKATVIPMSGRSVQIPALDHVTAPSAGNSAFLGGVVAQWTEEAATLNQTEPNLKQIDLTNYELSGYSKVSNTLLQDSAIGLEAFLMQLFSRAIAWYEDYAFLRGDGVKKPLGVINWTGLISVTRSGASAFALADAAGMYGRLLPGASNDSLCWVIHPTVITKVLQMTGGDNVIFLGNDIHGAPRWNILGIDVAISEKVPALNTLGDVLLCDFAHYLIGDRKEIEIAYSEHVAFLTNQSVWRFVSRVGGLPWLRDKVTLSDASNTLSPFVGLAAG
jgi:HK97 family phage major capsid protein